MVKKIYSGLLLLSLLVMSLLPTGYMPSISEDGHFTVEICTSDGMRSVKLTLSGHDRSPLSSDMSAEFCGFTTLHILAASEYSHVVALFAQIFKSDEWLEQIHLKSKLSHHESRAPPFL